MLSQKCVLICGVMACFLPWLLAEKSVLCYMAAWSVGRPDLGKFSVLDADTDHCTHIVYAFMGLDEATNEIKSIEPYIDLDVQGLGQNQLIKLKQLKFSNPKVKLLVSIGGWNEAGKKFSSMAQSAENRQIFIQSVTKFLRKYELDGLDFCWQFPGQRGGRPIDKENSITLFRELKEAFEPQGWLLTVHIIGKRYVMDSYDIKAVSDIVDFINLAAVEYNGPWERKTGAMAPLRSKNELNVEFSVDYMLKKGADRSKLLLGLPTYGHAYLLPQPPKDQYIGLFSNETFSSQWTNEFGITGYHETCYNMKNNEGWQEVWDEKSQTPFAFKERKLISFDNEKSLLLKADLVWSRLLGGVMIWSLDMDDFRGLCNGISYPLVTAVTNHINNEDLITTSEATNAVSTGKPSSNYKPLINDANDDKLGNTSSYKPVTDDLSDDTPIIFNDIDNDRKMNSTSKPFNDFNEEKHSTSPSTSTVDLNEGKDKNSSATNLDNNKEQSFQSENYPDVQNSGTTDWSNSWQELVAESLSSFIKFFNSIFRLFSAY